MAELKEYALTTLADVKESLGIPSGNRTKDNLIIRKINQATAMIENYCGRHFKKATYTDDNYNATHTDQIVLRQRPLIIDGDNPLSFSARDTSLNESDFTDIESELFFADVSAGILNLNFGAIGHWGAYKVTYTAGYDTIPDDLAEACASLAAYLITNADAGNVGVASKKEGQRQISYSGSSSGSNLSFSTIMQNLGIDEVIRGYANDAVFADK